MCSRDTFTYFNDIIICINNRPPAHPCCNTDPEEDVLGGVEAGGVDAGGVGRVPVADDPAGEAGDGAGRRGRVFALLGSSGSVCHHEVYGALGGAADLQNINHTSRLTFDPRGSAGKLTLEM